MTWLLATGQLETPLQKILTLRIIFIEIFKVKVKKTTIPQNADNFGNRIRDVK